MSFCVQRCQNRYQNSPRVLTDIITRHCYLPTTIINRHRISIYIRSNATNHQSFGNPAETRYHNTCSDDRYPGKDSHLPQRKSQNHDRGKTHNVAPIPTDGGIELQYLISHILGLRTQQSFSRKSALQRTRPEIRTQPTTPINHEIAEGVLQQTQQILNQSQQALMQAYVRQKRYYERKASANPLVVNDYCYALHPKAHSQATKLPFREYLWTGPYIAVTTLPNNNYLIRKTNLTQILRRI